MGKEEVREKERKGERGREKEKDREIFLSHGFQ